MWMERETRLVPHIPLSIFLACLMALLFYILSVNNPSHSFLYGVPVFHFFLVNQWVTRAIAIVMIVIHLSEAIFAMYLIFKTDRICPLKKDGWRPIYWFVVITLLGIGSFIILLDNPNRKKNNTTNEGGDTTNMLQKDP
eukprot:TRINITY_DN3487_c0_g1_i1.p1 TRINITY_DN3487_c0_g1~~TRINITY_DN3487_c0_g1_i1.p1  ORF type:complete len:139 (+),score=23.34 TRINITY_DN3487_c0_g1_i1:48-464(+)